MKLRFLCANHRLELEKNMDKALKFCQTGFDTGQFYSDGALWADAIPHLGCAFEVAEILLTHSAIDEEVSCDWLTTSARLLAHSFNRLHYASEAEEIIWMAINRLEQQLSQNPSHVLWMGRYLSSLYRELKSYIPMGDIVANGAASGIQSYDPMGLMH